MQRMLTSKRMPAYKALLKQEMLVLCRVRFKLWRISSAVNFSCGSALNIRWFHLMPKE